MPTSLKSRPTCDLCQKPVEEFTEEEGEGLLRGFVIFVAKCHGQVERQKVPRRLTRGLNFSKAFVVPLGLPSLVPAAQDNQDCEAVSDKLTPTANPPLPDSEWARRYGRTANPIKDYWDALDAWYRERHMTDDDAYDDFRERNR